MIVSHSPFFCLEKKSGRRLKRTLMNRTYEFLKSVALFKFAHWKRQKYQPDTS